MLRPAEVRELPLYFVLHVAGFRPPGAESGIRFQFMYCLFPSVGAEQEDAETVDDAMPVLVSKSDSVHRSDRDAVLGQQVAHVVESLLVGQLDQKAIHLIVKPFDLIAQLLSRITRASAVIDDTIIGASGVGKYIAEVGNVGT